LGVSYSWLLSGLHLSSHVVGHVASFIPMLWLGYAGMPRRIQDYPHGYAGWHSVATSGHLVVVLGLIAFLGLLSHATFFKRPLGPRH
jgi:cytochrome c oxidase subunit 1